MQHKQLHKISGQLPRVASFLIMYSMDNLGSIPAIGIFFIDFRDNSVSGQKLDRLLWKFVRYALSLSAIGEWGMHSQLWRKKIRYHEYFFPSAALVLCLEQLLVFQFFFFKNVHLKTRVLYADYLCKIIDQQQWLFNFDRFVYNFG